MKKLLLIDGNAIVHRAFHATPPFRTADGTLVNAVYGFASMLLNLLNNEQPDYIAASFDMKGKTFRHEEYKEYKATRKPAPDGLYEQFPIVKNLLGTFKIPIYEIEGFEADDVLGTLAKQADSEGSINTYIVTGDMDTLQLITDTTFVLAPHKGFRESIIYDAARVYEKYGLTKDQITDMKGLQGDNSDNIKGVRGIGPKTAQRLLQQYGTIESVYEHIEEITGSTKTKLENDKESAFFSKRLATIVTDVPMNIKLEDCKTHEYNHQEVLDLFESLQFKSLFGKLGSFNNHYGDKKIQESDTQPSLF